MKHQPQIDYSAFPKSASSAAKIEFLLQYAHLAPSTHNIQPWQFDIVGDICKVHYDPQLRLPENDPTGRDLYISLGCCIENLVLAARQFGVEANVTYRDGPGELAAEVSFKHLDTPQVPAPDTKLLEAIVARFNARGLFKKQPLPNDFLPTLEQLNHEYGPAAQVHTVTDVAGIDALAKLTAEGLQSAYHRPAFRQEIASWIRPNNSSALDGIPGYALRMNLPMSFLLPWLMKRFDIGGKLGQINYVSLRSAPLICVYTAPDNLPASQMQIGRLAERVMIEANARGMKTSIFVASVEIDDLYQQVQKVIHTDRIPQFLMVAGFISTAQGHTPRHPLHTRLRGGVSR